MRRPTPATGIATVALFFALTGTGLAVSHYVITSTKQIKPSVLKSLRGKGGAQGPQGPAGAQGVQGPQGPAGTSALSTLTTVVGATVVAPNEKVTSAEAICPAGSHAVSGGGFASIAGLDASEMETTHQSWFIVVNNESGIALNIHATVECAGAGQAVAARAIRPTHARVHRLVAEIESDLRRRSAR